MRRSQLEQTPCQLDQLSERPLNFLVVRQKSVLRLARCWISHKRNRAEGQIRSEQTARTTCRTAALSEQIFNHLNEGYEKPLFLQ